MDGEHTTPITAELGKQMLARRLMVKHGQGQTNWLHWRLHGEWLDIPRASRPASFYDFVIRELGKP